MGNVTIVTALCRCLTRGHIGGTLVQLLPGMLSLLALMVAQQSKPGRSGDTIIIDKVSEKSYTAFAANSCLFYRNRVVAIVGMLVEEKFPWNNQPC